MNDEDKKPDEQRQVSEAEDASLEKSEAAEHAAVNGRAQTVLTNAYRGRK